MKVALLIQARVNSTRFPGKVFEMLGEKQVLRHLVDTCESVKIFPKALEIETKVIVPSRDASIFEEHGYEVFESPTVDEDNLLRRYSAAVNTFGYDGFVRLTSDCPLLSKELIETTVKALMNHDYVTNTIYRTFQDGLDCQAINSRAFDYYKKLLPHEQHLFYFLESNQIVQKEFQAAGFSIHHILNSDKQILNPYLEENKLSIDTVQDLERVRRFYEQSKKREAE